MSDQAEALYSSDKRRYMMKNKTDSFPGSIRFGSPNLKLQINNTTGGSISDANEFEERCWNIYSCRPPMKSRDCSTPRKLWLAMIAAKLNFQYRSMRPGRQLHCSMTMSHRLLTTVTRLQLCRPWASTQMLTIELIVVILKYSVITLNVSLTAACPARCCITELASTYCTLCHWYVITQLSGTWIPAFLEWRDTERTVPKLSIALLPRALPLNFRNLFCTPFILLFTMKLHWQLLHSVCDVTCSVPFRGVRFRWSCGFHNHLVVDRMNGCSPNHVSVAFVRALLSSVYILPSWAVFHPSQCPFIALINPPCCQFPPIWESTQ